MSAKNRHPALVIWCRECGAAPGYRCHGPTGTIRPWGFAHWYRRFDFERGIDPGPQPTHAERLAQVVTEAFERYRSEVGK